MGTNNVVLLAGSIVENELSAKRATMEHGLFGVLKLKCAKWETRFPLNVLPLDLLVWALNDISAFEIINYHIMPVKGCDACGCFSMSWRTVNVHPVFKATKKPRLQ
jgi:hypothetical protein